VGLPQNEDALDALAADTASHGFAAGVHLGCAAQCAQDLEGAVLCYLHEAGLNVLSLSHLRSVGYCPKGVDSALGAGL